MSVYYLPDITGTDPDYFEPNLPFLIYKKNQKIFFENSPVFAESLRLVLADGSGTLLVRNTDWYVNPEDIDDAAMSRAYLENPNFNKTLVKSVTLISDRVVNKKIAVNVQQFYLTQPGRTFDDGRPFEVTPDLIKWAVSSIADLKQQVAMVSSPTASNEQIPQFLPFDLNKEKAGNMVTGESVTVNTVSGANVIRLSRGAYFADSLVLRTNGSLLNAQTDYLPLGLSPLTKQSTNRSGIYQFILINKPLSGAVTIDYHAVGGEVQLDDVNAVYNQLLAIKNYLQEEIFLTPTSIVDTPAFQSFHNRLTSLETNVRSILSGTPTYGDATAGQTVIRPIRTIDANFHWWTIANLYQVQGSNDVVLADQFKARIFFPGSKISVSFTLDTNFNQSREPVSFTTDSLVFDPTYTLFGDVSVASPIYPMFRVVWSTASQGFSGASLQVGLPLPSLNDQMIIEDLSSQESCWLLDKTNQQLPNTPPVTPGGPLDDNFLLPDRSTTWSSTGPSSLSKLCIPKYQNGYLLYAGAIVPLSQINNSNDNTQLFTSLLPNYFPLSEIQSVVVTLLSADETLAYDVEIPTLITVSNQKKGIKSFVDSSRGCHLTLLATLRLNVQGNPIINLNANAITNNVNSPLADQIRYIRVRV